MALEQPQQDMSVVLVRPETGQESRSDATISQSEATAGSEGSGARQHDTVTIAQLRTRVEQQSSLIGMLKQRNDETFKELNQYRGLHEKLLAQNRELQHTLMETTSSKSTLEQRFHTLSSNHDELIKIKDEYKTENQKLRDENFKYRTNNAERVSVALQEKEKQLSTLREEVTETEERIKVMMSRHTLLEEEVRELKSEEKKKEQTYVEEIEREQKQRKVAQQKYADSEEKLKSIEKELLQLQKRNRELELSSKQKEDTLKANTVEMESLQLELRKLQKEKEVLSLDLQRISLEMAQDAQITALKEQLRKEQQKAEKLHKDYLAFQKHSCDLLQKERDLNSKLRHISDL